MKTFLYLSLYLALAGCKPHLGETHKINLGDQVLLYNLRTEPPTLDWNKIEDTTSRVVIDNIMEPLVAFDYSVPEARLVPGLAKTWTTPDKGKTWIVTFNEGFLWNDGVPFHSQQVVDSLERLLNPATGAMGSDDFFVIQGAQEYNEGTLRDFKKIGVDVDQEGRLVFQLKRPLVFFPYLLTLPQVLPIRKDLIAKYGDQWTSPNNLVTLGPYNLSLWKHDDHILLTANEKYFRAKPEVKIVKLLMVSEESTALNLFETGKLDVLFSLPSLEIPRLSQKKEYHSFTNSCVAFLVFNVNKPPLDDVWVRRAFVQGVRRTSLVKLLGGGRKVNRGWLPHGVLGFQSEVGLRFNLKEAKKALALSKYGSSDKVPSIDIYYNTSDNYKPLFELIQDQLKTNLGLKVTIKNLEWKSYLQFIRSDMPHVHRMGWIGTYPDPDIMMRPLLGGSTSINPSWKSDSYNQLVYSGMSEFDPKKREALYQKANKIIAEKELPVMNIYTCAQQYLISDRIQYYPFNKEAKDLFKFVQWKR